MPRNQQPVDISGALGSVIPAMHTVAKGRGTVDDVASRQPFSVVAPPDLPGYPFGDVWGGSRFHFDTLEYQRAGIIGGPIFGVFADRGKAKTTLLKEYGMFMSTSDVGTGRPSRTGAEIVRRNAGVNEWDEYAKFFGEPVVDMNEYQFNPLTWGSGLPISRRTAWMIDAFEYQNSRLSLDERFMLSAIMRRLYALDRHGSPLIGTPDFESMFELITRFDLTSEVAFYKEAVGAEEFSEEVLALLEQDYDETEAAQTRRMLRRRLGNLLRGEFGQVFSSKGRPIESILGSDQQIFDYSTVSRVARPLIQSLVFEIRDYATLTQNFDLTVEYEPYDETNELLRNPITAKRLLHMVKVIRGIHKVVGLSFHRLQDTLAIGDHDDELRNIILNLLEEIEVVFIGGLKGRRSRDMIAEWKDLDTITMQRIATQGPGEFCVVIEGRDPFFIDRPLNNTLKVISESNMANRRRADRPPTPQH